MGLLGGRPRLSGRENRHLVLLAFRVPQGDNDPTSGEDVEIRASAPSSCWERHQGAAEKGRTSWTGSWKLWWFLSPMSKGRRASTLTSWDFTSTPIHSPHRSCGWCT